MLNIATGRRARTELPSSARAPGAETIGVRSCLLAIARNVGGKRLVEESQFGAGSVGRFSTGRRSAPVSMIATPRA